MLSFHFWSLSLSRKNLNQPKPKQSKKKKSDKPPIPPPQPPSKVSSSLLYGYMCSLPARVLHADASVFIMLGPALILRFCIKLTINFNNKIAEVIVFVRSVSWLGTFKTSFLFYMSVPVIVNDRGLICRFDPRTLPALCSLLLFIFHSFDLIVVCLLFLHFPF